MRSKDRFRGCLLAGAAGDALGYEVEFMSEQQIFRRFGAAGITGYCLHNGVAEISDDTQMSLFTAAGLIDGELERACGSTAPLSAYVRSAYKDWYRTQTGQYPLPREYGTRDKNKASSRLLAVPALFSRRAPGTTCLTALGSSKEGTVEAPINNSKGCGCVMRVAPVGLFFCGRDIPIEISDRIAAETAAITHGHELGLMSSAALAHILRRLAESEKETLLAAVQDAMAAIKLYYPDSPFLNGFLALLCRAVELSRTAQSDLDAIHILGEGWVAEEALAIAVYCALRYPDDLERALTASVNHGGDSDSTGSMTGNILGASLGMGAIPEKYLKDLELRDAIIGVADELYDCSEYPGNGHGCQTL